MRNHIIYLALVLALAGCSRSSFNGDEELVEQMENAPIFLGSKSNATTRSHQGLERYEGTFKVYAAKKIGTTYTKAIGNYAVWNTSNDPAVLGDWEYVGSNGDRKTVVKEGKAGTADNFTLPQDQVKKYWDYKASEYLFWAVAPYTDSITYTIIDNIVTKATIKGIGGHLTANNTSTANVYKDYYLAQPVKVVKKNFGNVTDDAPVEFDFDHMHTLVRVAIYENIPNYHVDSVLFHRIGETDSLSENVVLCRDDNAFVGGNNGTATMTHDNDKMTYDLRYETGAGKGLTAQKWIEFGSFSMGMADPADQTYFLKLFGSDADMDASTCYFNVLPTPYEYTGTNAKPIRIKIDFNITSDDALKEKIRVRGVSTTVPTEFSTWLPNHAYSYVFKVSQASLGVAKIEFDAEASNITEYNTDHEEEIDE